MNISTNSWHYKFLKTMKDGKHVPDSLCAYFWSIVWYIAMIILLVMILGLVSLAASTPISMFMESFGYLPIEEQFGWFGPILAVIIGAASICTVIAVAIAIVFGMLAASEYATNKTTNSVPIQFIKATKGKYCPRIDFVKEDKK